MHNTESVLENETHKPLWNFEMKTVLLISARRRDLVIINKKKKKKRRRIHRIVNLALPADHRVKSKKVKRRISTWTLLEN